MKLTNNQIYTYATNLVAAFQDSEQKFPVKVNFYLQKNKNLLLSLAQDIEKARIELLQQYGKIDPETNTFVLDEDKIEIASKELTELFDLEQEVNIYTVDIDSFNNDLCLTTGQMEALLFMIN